MVQTFSLEVPANVHEILAESGSTVQDYLQSVLYELAASNHPNSLESMSKADVDRIIEQGLDDVAAGRARPAKHVFAEIFPGI